MHVDDVGANFRAEAERHDGVSVHVDGLVAADYLFVTELLTSVYLQLHISNHQVVLHFAHCFYQFDVFGSYGEDVEAVVLVQAVSSDDELVVFFVELEGSELSHAVTQRKL